MRLSMLLIPQGSASLRSLLSRVAPVLLRGGMLRLYICGYRNQIQSSRRSARDCGRNLEFIRLTGRLKPDFKTISDFRKDNGPAIRKVCQQFVTLCRNMDLLDADVVAIDGSRFKALNGQGQA